jgi:hypothetical protein
LHGLTFTLPKALHFFASWRDYGWLALGSTPGQQHQGRSRDSVDERHRRNLSGLVFHDIG